MGNFMGKDGFIWFVGVVEDRNDPKFLGRLRVRCLGYHTHNTGKLPTNDLPWAHPMNPITSATVSGVGQSPLGAVEGTWVIGFFRDGSAAQEPVIMGTLPGIPTKEWISHHDSYDGIDTFTNTGFFDPKGNYPKYAETDVNRLAVGVIDVTPYGGSASSPPTNPHNTLTIRKADIDSTVSQADIESHDRIAEQDQILPPPAGAGPRVAQAAPDPWSEPITPYAAQYPHNHVYESEAGHVREMDDTPGAERIHERHNSGTGYEIFPDGSKVTRVKKDNYSIITEDDYVHIQGDSTKTVDGGLRVFINKDRSGSDNNYNIQVGAGANVTIQVDEGDINLIAPSDTGNINMKCGGSLAIDAASGIYIRTVKVDAEVNGPWTEIVTGINKKTGSEIDMDAGTINLN